MVILTVGHIRVILKSKQYRFDENCRGQWQASFVCEKSACLAAVNVTEQILLKFPNSMKSWEN